LNLSIYGVVLSIQALSCVPQMLHSHFACLIAQKILAVRRKTWPENKVDYLKAIENLLIQLSKEIRSE
jgi:hypothetical protein